MGPADRTVRLVDADLKRRYRRRPDGHAVSCVAVRGAGGCARRRAPL